MCFTTTINTFWYIFLCLIARLSGVNSSVLGFDLINNLTDFLYLMKNQMCLTSQSFFGCLFRLLRSFSNGDLIAFFFFSGLQTSKLSEFPFNKQNFTIKKCWIERNFLQRLVKNIQLLTITRNSTNHQETYVETTQIQ